MNELQNHVCVEHEPCIMNFPNETCFRFSKYYCKVPLYFLRSTDFKAMNKEGNTLKGKVTKSLYEQVAVGVHFYLRSELSNRFSFESFGKIW